MPRQLVTIVSYGLIACLTPAERATFDTMLASMLHKLFDARIRGKLKKKRRALEKHRAWRLRARIDLADDVILVTVTDFYNLNGPDRDPDHDDRDEPELLHSFHLERDGHVWRLDHSIGHPLPIPGTIHRLIPTLQPIGFSVPACNEMNNIAQRKQSSSTRNNGSDFDSPYDDPRDRSDEDAFTVFSSDVSIESKLVLDRSKVSMDCFLVLALPQEVITAATGGGNSSERLRITQSATDNGNQGSIRSPLVSAPGRLYEKKQISSPTIFWLQSNLPKHHQMIHF